MGVLTYLKENDVDIAFIQETWLKKSDKATISQIKDFRYNTMSSRKPRRYDLGGGVALLYKNNLDVHRVKQTSKYSSFEFIECTLKTRSENYRFVNIYRVEYSQKHQVTFQTFIDEFSELMSELMVKKGQVILVGDYNIHVENEADNEAKKFEETLKLFNLHLDWSMDQLINLEVHLI